MKKKIIFVFFLGTSLFLLSGKGYLAPLTDAPDLTTLSSSAATYYIDASGGNDAYDGLTEQTAWQTVAKVNSSSFAPGEKVLFKRGQRWREHLRISSSGTVDMPIVFGAYGDGEPPIIDATSPTDGWTALGNNLYSLSWVVQDVSLLKPSVLIYGGEPMPPVYTLTFADLSVAPVPYNILLQAPWQTMIVTSADINDDTVSGISIFHDWNTVYPVNALVGTIVTNPPGAPPIDVTPKLSSLTEPGHWYWQDNTLYLYSEIPPDDMEIEVVSQLFAIDSNYRDYITIQDLAVRGGNSASLILQGTDHAILRNLLIYDTGMLYWGSGITVWNSNYNTISDNEVRSTLKNGIMCTAWNGVETRGNHITGNYIHHTGGTGVVLDNPGASDNIIEHNSIGYPNQLNFDSAGIHLALSGTGNVIRFNMIFNGGSSYLKSAGIMADNNPGPTQISYNIIYGNNNGGIDLTGSGHEIYNNTLYKNNEAAWNVGEITFFPVGTGVSNCTVKNNFMVASDSKFLFTVANWGQDSTKGHDIDYNAYMGNAEKPFLWGDNGASDFNTWQTQSLQDAHSLETTIGLNNPPLNFELANNSPAIDAGTDVGLILDFAGKPVPQNNIVDIGALEYSFSGTIELGSATYSVAEDGILATINVIRTAGFHGAISVDYATSDGTALAGSDYTAASGTLFWTDGDTLDKIFTITILGDVLAEGNETVNIVISNPTGGAFLGTPNSALLTITDTSEPYCGNTICDPDEDSCICPVDCGSPPPSEDPATTCDDGIDNDCDTLIDVADPDCIVSNCAGLNRKACKSDPQCAWNAKDKVCEDVLDCIVTEEPETSCGDGIDNDCDGLTDSEDPDCSIGSCNNDGICDAGEDCLTCRSDCAGWNRGNPSTRYCCGNGIQEGPEGDGSLCDGNY